MKNPQNLFRIPRVSEKDEEQFDILAQTPEITLERIASFGLSSPEGFWYDQTRREWVTVLQGEALLQYEDGREVPLKKGDFITIEAGERHRVARTSSDCLWLALHYPS